MYIETDRLIIRDWQPLHDARHAMDIYGDKRVTRWIGEGETDNSIHAVQGRLQRYASRSKKISAGEPTTVRRAIGTGIWAVVEKSIDHIIGSILLIPLPGEDGQPTGNIEIGWHFRPASWGYGYATEAATQIIQYAHQQMGLSSVFAVTLPDNTRSIAVMERLGMEALGITEQYYGGRSLLLYRLRMANLPPSSYSHDSASLPKPLA